MILQELFQDKPTKLWSKRMVEYGDDMFTEERIQMSEQVLDYFINELITLQGTKDTGQIMKAVEKVVLTFNEMNEEHDYFIETMEREELADFIDKAARLAGLHIKEGEDITEEWREW
jgi:GDP-D-mannose dehydratase